MRFGRVASILPVAPCRWQMAGSQRIFAGRAIRCPAPRQRPMSASNQASAEQFNLARPWDGLPFRISRTRHPGAPTGPENVPAAFVSDSDFEFALTAEILRLAMTGGTRPGAVLPGVACGAIGAVDSSVLRTADLTLPPTPATIGALDDLAGLVGGQSARAEALLVQGLVGRGEQPHLKRRPAHSMRAPDQMDALPAERRMVFGATRQ